MDLNAPELLVEFQQENPDAVVHIRIGQSEGTTPALATPLPPTSSLLISPTSSTCPMHRPHAHQVQYKAEAALFASMEAAVAQVRDDTDGSAIIRRVMALSQATADGHAAEVRQ